MVLKVLSGSMVTKVSRNGSEPCCVGTTVNCMCGFPVVYVVKKVLTVFCPVENKAVINKP